MQHIATLILGGSWDGFILAIASGQEPLAIEFLFYIYEQSAAVTSVPSVVYSRSLRLVSPLTHESAS